MEFDPNKFKAVIFDSDGVLVEEDAPLPYAKELIQHLRSKDILCIVLSNNSTKHPKRMVEHYRDIDLEIDDVVNSGFLTAVFCNDHDISSVYMVGENGLKEILNEHDIQISEDAEDAVIVGMDRTLTYEKLAIATRLIRSGAKFIGTNPDKSFPTPRGLEPGAGSMIAALEASTDQNPEIIVGKPQTVGFEYILDKYDLDKDEVIMIGDRYETDIQGALDTGIPAVVVNTGVASTRDNPHRFQNREEVPLIQSLEELM